MIVLNEGQQAAHDTLINYLTGRDRSCRMWLLKGYAGTGKTTTVGTIVDTLIAKSKGVAPEMRPSIVVSAPTHKAVQVLKKLSSLGDHVDYATIHSLLGLKESINIQTGKQEFKQSYGENGPRIEGYTVLFLDEVSMLSDELFLLLNPYIEDGLKIVMMGDPIQIPPINETDPIPFKRLLQDKYKIGVMELTQTVRQAMDNPILKYATELRGTYKHSAPHVETHINEATGDGIEVISAVRGTDKIKDLLDKLFRDPEFEKDPDFMKVIAWTNATVDHYNKHIRALLYGGLDIPIVMRGEKMICDGPVFSLWAPGSIVLYTNQEVEVIDYLVNTKTVRFAVPYEFGQADDTVEKEIKYYHAEVEYDAYDRYLKSWVKKRTSVHIVHDDSIAEFTKLQEGHKKRAIYTKDNRQRGRLWAQFYENEKQFAWMKYNYAITAHKSQGSTYDNVMMLDWDIDKNRKIEERNRIKYVAATRSRHKLYIVNLS